MKDLKITKTFEELHLADANLWDSGELGRDDAHVKVADPKRLKALKNALNIVSEKEFFKRGNVMV